MKETDNDIVLLLIKENKKLEEEITTLKDSIKGLKDLIDVCQAQINIFKWRYRWSSKDVEEVMKNYEEIKNKYNYPSYK